jgi:hypothetical protein
MTHLFITIENPSASFVCFNASKPTNGSIFQYYCTFRNAASIFSCYIRHITCRKPLQHDEWRSSKCIELHSRYVASPVATGHYRKNDASPAEALDCAADAHARGAFYWFILQLMLHTSYVHLLQAPVSSFLFTLRNPSSG